MRLAIFSLFHFYFGSVFPWRGLCPLAFIPSPACSAFSATTPAAPLFLWKSSSTQNRQMQRLFAKKWTDLLDLWNTKGPTRVWMCHARMITLMSLMSFDFVRNIHFFSVEEKIPKKNIAPVIWCFQEWLWFHTDVTLSWSKPIPWCKGVKNYSITTPSGWKRARSKTHNGKVVFC